VITSLIISSFITLFIRSTDEEKPFRKLFLRGYSYFENRFILKAFFTCLECRILWLSIVLNSAFAFTYDIKYLFFIPLTWICSIYMYKIIE
jgi:hypothetical protein